MTTQRTKLSLLASLFSSFFFTTAFGQSPGSWLGDLTWPEAESRIASAPAVVIPFGAGANEHGPQLPMNADAKVMEYLCERAIEALPVVVAPPILHGWFPAFRQFPGTEVADHDAFVRYVSAVARSLVRHGTRRLVFLNTGISRATGLPLSIVAREIQVEAGIPTLVVSWDDLEGPEMAALQEEPVGGHGDELETSIHLFLQPEWVHMDRAVRDVPPGRSKGPGYRPGSYSRDRRDPNYSETGITGDPTLATAEKGKQALDLLTREWLKALRSFAEAPTRKE